MKIKILYLVIGGTLGLVFSILMCNAIMNLMDVPKTIIATQKDLEEIKKVSSNIEKQIIKLNNSLYEGVTIIN